MRWLSIVLVLVPAVVLACLWDSDTLAIEAKGMPEMVQVITGRFERNTPLYYEMRLKRVVAEMKEHPEKLALYDDAGVACDRLGDDDKAIAYMAAKKMQLDKLADSAAKSDGLYKYHANTGTFYAHKFLKEGAQAPSLIEKAVKHIETAIEINPDAHFGREIVQLGVIKWILESKKNPQDARTLFEYLSEHEHWPPGIKEDDRIRKGATGLAGLITLGSAWESPDVFAALGDALAWTDQASLGHLAILRVKELIKAGRKPLDTALAKGELHASGSMPSNESEEFRTEEYKRLRDEADSYAKSREEFMNARLRQGKHPDTDADFWAGYHDAGPPQINQSLSANIKGKMGKWTVLFPSVLIGTVLGALVVGLMRMRKSARSRTSG